MIPCTDLVLIKLVGTVLISFLKAITHSVLTLVNQNWSNFLIGIVEQLLLLHRLRLLHDVLLR